MCPPPTHEATADPSLGHVVRCDRIAAGARTSLVRVTLALGGQAPAAAAGAQLVVVDGEQTSRCAALPAPLPAAADTLTLGFAVPASATLLGLVLDGRPLSLSPSGEAQHEIEQLLRATRERLAESRRAQSRAETELAESQDAREQAQAHVAAAHRARMQAEARLVESQRARALTEEHVAASEHARALVAAQLEQSRGARADVEHARDAALRAAARAEAAAHDANARAEAFARRQPERESKAPRGTLRAAAAAGAVGLAALLVAILAWPARDEDGDGGVRGVAAASASPVAAPRRAARVDPLARRLNIPADYLALYRRAAARYGLDWTRLAAIGAIESGHGQAHMLGIATGASARGAIGPAQFLPGTWERYGLDGDADGTRDPRDPADAIPAMASYLRASGAPQDWRAALRSYNHSDAYVTAVETLAASLRSGAS